MSYESINPIPQFNFQINRVLTYGSPACNREEVIKASSPIRTLPEWNAAWLSIANRAEREQRWLHAAYYYRMAEFFLKSDDPQKAHRYEQCIENFYKGFAQELPLPYRRQSVPFEGGSLPCMEIPAPQPKGTVLVCGGYDSFFEEFVLQVSALASRGYTVILFDGPGQGKCLREKMFFRYDFEKPATAVINYFHLDRCAMVGISWGGYFALRSAAFEQRITAAVAYDVLDDGLEVMTNVFPAPIRQMLRFAYRRQKGGMIRTMTDRIRKKNILADWALSQGMYITGTDTPYAFYQSLSKHTLKNITGRLTQDILLLAGEQDHYVPVRQFYRLQKNIHGARTLTSHLFTKAEGGEQHCQIGNHRMAINIILNWLDRVFGD